MASQSATLTFHVKSTGSTRDYQRGNHPASRKQGHGKFCSICKSAGKSVEEYTSHFVRENRDPNSRVVCPVLLDSVCRYCGKKGHMKSHCHILKKRNEKRNQDRETAKEYRAKPSSRTFSEYVKIDASKKVSSNDDEWQKKHTQQSSGPETSSYSGRFAALDDDSDDEVQKLHDTQRMPAIGGKTLPPPLPYGKMMKRVTSVQQVPKANTISEIPQKKSVSFHLPKIETKPIAKLETKPEPKESIKALDFATDFDDLDWADECEKNQDEVVVETPSWAMSDDEEKSAKIKENIFALQSEIADGWED